MNPRPSLFARLLALFRRHRAAQPAPAHASGRPATRAPRESRVRGIEPLEGRIAPATLVDASTISYTDLDGDLVTVKFSKPLFDPAASNEVNKLDSIFKFTNGTASSPFSDPNSPNQQLQLIDLTQTETNIDTFLKAAEGVSITITAVTPQGGTGDGLAKVGEIEATNIALGRVEVDGDLGQIDCGRGVVKVGLKALIVNSLGKFGSTTQVSGGSATERLESLIKGELTTLQVATDLHGYLHVTDSSGIVGNAIKTVPGRIGSITIGGSLIGASLVDATSDNTGSIQVQRGIGAVQILGLGDPEAADAGLLGGGGKKSGSIVAGAGIASIKVADSLKGGGGADSGSIIALNGTLPLVAVGNDVTGGAGLNSGTIQALALTKGTVGGDLTGSGGENSGTIDITKTITSLTITGNVTGSTGINSGGISSGGVATLINIGGNVTGAAGFHSGAIDSLTGLGTVKIGGQIVGGGGDRSGTVISDGRITSLVADKLVGGTGENSGSIFAALDPALKGTLVSVTLLDGIEGHSGISSGSIVAGKIGTVKIGTATDLAEVKGGNGDFSGAIISTSTIGTVSIFGSVTGGAGDESASIQARGNITTVSISANLQGGTGDYSGMIRAQEVVSAELTGTAANLGTVTIGGDILGGAGLNSGRVEASGNLTKLTAGNLQAGGVDGSTTNGSGAVVIGSGFLGAGNAGSILFRGAVTSDPDATTTNAGAPEIFVDGRLTSLKVNGGLVDARVSVNRDLVAAIIGEGIENSTISAAGQAKPVLPAGDVAIGSLTVNGNVSGSEILAGYSLVRGTGQSGSPPTSLTAVNADASIGTVRINGSWTASSLVAGVEDVDGDGFGDADDVKIDGGTDLPNLRSQIASVSITGAVAGTDGSTSDRYGFVAQRILAFKAGALALKFTGATDAPTELGTTGDVTVREVPL